MVVVMGGDEQREATFIWWLLQCMKKNREVIETFVHRLGQRLSFYVGVYLFLLRRQKKLKKKKDTPKKRGASPASRLVVVYGLQGLGRGRAREGGINVAGITPAYC